MNLRPTLLLGLLCSIPVQAEVVCQDCTFDFFSATGGYLGAYSPGDRGTFNWQTVFTTNVSTFWVVDLNANGTLVLTATTPVTAQFRAFRAELYADWISQCEGTAGGACESIGFHPEIVDCTTIDLGETECEMAPYFTDLASTTRRWALKAPLVAGRYVVRVIAQKGATVTGSYAGRVALR